MRLIVALSPITHLEHTVLYDNLSLSAITGNQRMIVRNRFKNYQKDPS